MNKTCTCKELGGVCDEKFSGETLMDIVQKAMPHMMSDEAHKTSIMDLEKHTGENRAQWMERIQNEFDAKAKN